METFVLPDQLVNKICCAIVNRLLAELHLFSPPINDLHELSNGVALVELVECFESLTFHQAPAKVARQDRPPISPKSNEETNLEFVERWLKTEGIVMDSKRSIRMIFEELDKSNEELANFIASFTPAQRGEASVASIVAQQKTLIYARSIAYISALCYAIFTIFLKHKPQFVHTVPGYNFYVADNELLHILFYTKWKLTEEELLIKDLEFMRLKDRLEMMEIEKRRLDDIIRFYGIKKEDTQKIMDMQKAMMGVEERSSVGGKVSTTRLEVKPLPVTVTNSRNVAPSTRDPTKLRPPAEMDSISSVTISSLAETFSVGTITDLHGLDKDIVAIYRQPLREPQTQHLRHSSRLEDLRNVTAQLDTTNSLPPSLKPQNILTTFGDSLNRKHGQEKLEEKTGWQQTSDKVDRVAGNSRHRKPDKVDGDNVHEDVKTVWQQRPDNVHEDVKTVWHQRPNLVNEEVKTVWQQGPDNVHEEAKTVWQQRPDMVNEEEFPIFRPSKLNEVKEEDADLDYYDNMSFDYNNCLSSDLSSVSNGYKMKFEYNKHRIERALNGNRVDQSKSSKQSSAIDSDSTSSQTPQVRRKAKVQKPTNPPPPLPTSRPPPSSEPKQHESSPQPSTSSRADQPTSTGSMSMSAYGPREEHVLDDEQQRNRILIARLLAELSYEKKKKSKSPQAAQPTEPMLRETNVDYI